MLKYIRGVIPLTTGEKIRKARTEKGWTQKQLGESCGIAEPTIRRYELGKLKPKKETLKKIAAPLGIYYLELYGDEESSEIRDYIKTGMKLGYNAQVAEMKQDFLEPFMKQGYEFTEEERKMVSLFNQLDIIAQLRVILSLDTLSRDPRYRKAEHPQEADEGEGEDEDEDKK